MAEETRKGQEKKIRLRAGFLIPIVLIIAIIVAYAFIQAHQLEQRILAQNYQLLELKGDKERLARQLQEANLKISALSSANNFVEKDNQQLNLLSDALEKQLERVTIDKNIAIEVALNQLKEIINHQEKTIAFLKAVNVKLDTVLSQTGPQRHNKKVDVFLSPGKERKEIVQ